jgi:hypothetical protein
MCHRQVYTRVDTTGRSMGTEQYHVPAGHFDIPRHYCTKLFYQLIFLLVFVHIFRIENGGFPSLSVRR